MAPIPNLLRERERGICIDRKRSCNPSLVWRLAPVNYPSTSSLSCSTSLAFSDDGAQLVVGDESGKLNFLNATNFLDTTAAFDSVSPLGGADRAQSNRTLYHATAALAGTHFGVNPLCQISSWIQQ